MKTGTPAFEKYCNKEVFVVKECSLPDGKKLATYYHAFGHCADNATQSRARGMMN